MIDLVIGIFLICLTALLLTLYLPITTGYIINIRIRQIIAVFAIGFSLLLYVFYGNALNVLQWHHYQDNQLYYQRILTRVNQQKLPLSVAIHQIKERVDTTSSDLYGLYILGKLLLADNQAHLASEVLSRATEIAPEDELILSAYALAVFDAGEDKQLVIQLLQRVLKISPEHSEAKNLLAGVYFQQGKFEQAIAMWQSLQQQLATQSQEFQIIEKLVLKAKAQSLISPQLRIKILLTGDIELEQQPEALTLFVIVKLAKNQMPAWVKKVRLTQLPLQVELTAANAMLATESISDKEVTVSAKISHNATISGIVEDFTAQQRISLEGPKIYHVKLHLTKKNSK